jgi:UDP-N-acetylmuramoyl-L-alanyl-D-glutamate--2,6-diaminopimelate ligase
MESILRIGRNLIPKKVFEACQPIYHYALALSGALLYRFPSQDLKVIAVTGTKGKSSTVEMVNAILEEAGLKTAVAGTVRFKIADSSKPNLYKMTMPGRFFLHRFLRQSVNAGCTHAVIEMTSEAAKQFRHKFIAFDALIFTNLAPEHIESHGSYEKYVEAKLSIAKAVAESNKKEKVLVVNADDKEAPKFLTIEGLKKITYSLSQAESLTLHGEGMEFLYKNIQIVSPLKGEFNTYNLLGAISYAESQNISLEVIKKAIAKLKKIPGRVEEIKESQNFKVVVDYAHTPDSLRALYKAFPGKKICVLGNTGGGRDTWKRPEMGKIANEYCESIILTNEDPYDEDPRVIVEAMAQTIDPKKLEIIMDRREALRHAFKKAKAGDAVLITGKGTDPYIMEANGKKLPWSDAKVAREELQSLH